MQTFPRPANLNGRQLAAELRAAGVPIDDDGVLVDGADRLALDVTEAQAQAARDVLATHVPIAPPDTYAAFRTALQNATTVAALRDALLGSTGPGAQPRVR